MKVHPIVLTMTSSSVWKGDKDLRVWYKFRPTGNGGKIIYGLETVDLYYNLTSIASISIQYFYVVNNSSGGNLSRIFIPRDPDVRLNALTAGKKAATARSS